MEAKNSHDLPSASLKTRKTSWWYNSVQVPKRENLRSHWMSPGWSPKAQEPTSYVAGSSYVQVLQEEGPLPGSETGLLSNTWKWIVREDTCAGKTRDVIGKGRLGAEQEGEGTQENCSATAGCSLGFYGDGISFQVVLSQSFWLRVPPSGALFSQDGCQREDSGRWSDMWCLLLTFPELFWLVEAY